MTIILFCILFALAISNFIALGFVVKFINENISEINKAFEKIDFRTSVIERKIKLYE